MRKHVTQKNLMETIMERDFVNRKLSALVVVFLTFAVLLSEASAQTTEVVAFDGFSANGNGFFSMSQMRESQMGDAGYVTFVADFLEQTNGGNSDDWGIFQSNGTTITELHREGDLVPNGNGVLDGFSTTSLPVVNQLGQVVSLLFLEDTDSGNSNDTALFMADGTSVVELVREGDPAPGGDGTFSDALFTFELNNAGQVVFETMLDDTFNCSVIYVAEGQSLTQIARAGDIVSDGNGGTTTITSVIQSSINDLGQVVFYATTLDGSCIFLNDDGALIQIAKQGQLEPGGDGEFRDLNNGISINNAGQLAFTSGLFVTNSSAGLFMYDGSQLASLARRHDPAPDGIGEFDEMHRDSVPLINETGQVLFVTDIDNSGSSECGVFRFDGNSQLQIARENYPVPIGIGTFDEFPSRSFNNLGQVVFHAELDDTQGSNDDEAIYFYDDNLGLLQVAREGDPLLGGVIRSLCLSSDLNETDARKSLNDCGQVSFFFRLDDFSVGVAVWTPPISEFQPASLEVFRGNSVSGGLSEVQQSDDMRAIYNPGFVINNLEAPVWLVLNGKLPTDNPDAITINLESQAGTPGLTHTIEVWNWTQDSYDIVGQAATSFNTDAVTTIALGSSSPEYAQVLTGAVRARVGYRKTGFTINFPWEVRVDQFSWSID